MKRTAVILVVAAGALGALAAAAVVWRAPLAEAGIRAWLRSAGLAEPSLTVTRIGTGGIELEALHAGTGRPLEIGRLLVAYTVAGLLDGRVGDVEVSDARVPVTLTDDGFRVAGIPLGGDTSPPAAGTEAGTALPFETLRVRNASLDADTPLGPATLVLEGTARQRVGEGLAASFDFELRGDGIDFAGTVAASGATLSDFTGELIVARGGATFANAVLREVTGTGEVVVRAGGLARAGLALDAGGADLPSPEGPLRGSAQLRLDYAPPDATLDAVFHEASGAGSYALRLDEAILSAGDGTFAGVATLHASADRLALADVDARRLRLDAPIRITVADGRGAILLRDAGTIAAEEVRIADSLRTTAPLRIDLSPSDAPALGVDFAAGTAPTYAASLGIEALSLEVLRDDALPVPVEARDLRLALSGEAGGAGGNVLRGRLSAASAVLPGQAVGLDVLAATFDLEGERPTLTAELRVGSIVQQDEPPLFAPLAAEGTIAGPLDALVVEAALRGGDGAQRIRLEGVWPPQANGGGIVATLGPFAFARGGLQPGDLSPRLRAVEAARGRVVGSARVRETKGALSLTGALAVDAPSFEIAGTRVEDVATRMEFTDLAGPMTAPGQVLTISRIGLPTPLDDLRAVYRLEAGPTGAPLLRIDSARTNMLGGSVSLSELALDLAGEAQDLPFRVDGIELASLLALADLDGIEGTGSLHGEVPITLSGSSVAIRGARLESAGGVLHIRSDTAANLLAAQGEQVDLALRALEDFRYSELSIDIDKPAEGKARLALSTLGHNPAVLDGHPFRFNVTLTSNVDELVAALLQGYRIATDALGQRPGRP